MNWNKSGTGTYETSDRQFQVRTNEDRTSWMLLRRNDDTVGNWDWCQSYGLMRDAKEGAQWIADNS